MVPQTMTNSAFGFNLYLILLALRLTFHLVPFELKKKTGTLGMEYLIGRIDPSQVFISTVTCLYAGLFQAYLLIPLLNKKKTTNLMLAEYS